MADTLAKRTSDFVSQGTIDAGLQPVDDALGHDAMALAILHKAVFLPPGAVIAVQGAWGRGKTDVLLRVATMVRDPKKRNIPEGLIGDALWINPWQYGTPDLLTPLVLAILERIPEAERKKDGRLRAIAETLLRAGLNFGMKAVGTTMALGPAVSPLLSAAADPLDRLLGALFAAGEGAKSDRPDADPVAVMGDRFAELAQKLLDTKGKAADARVLVCVDDLDRCLPDRQVALLEAIRFLISAGAPVTFLIALDPTLARQAILTHYKTTAFDPDRYLDKMFDLRVNLPSLGPRVADLVKHHVTREVRAMGHVMKIADALTSLLSSDKAPSSIEAASIHAFNTPDLANPRIIRRVFDRLYLLAVSRSADKLRPLTLREPEYRQLLLWLAITERFPAIRAAAQASTGTPGDDIVQRLTALQQAYEAGKAAGAAAATTALTRGPLDDLLAAHRLPSPTEAPELVAIFAVLAGVKDWTGPIKEVDEALVAAGL
ncbi:MAG: P-loop NTPase fold protein [Polyangiaceae bacterium]